MIIRIPPIFTRKPGVSNPSIIFQTSQTPIKKGGGGGGGQNKQLKIILKERLKV